MKRTISILLLVLLCAGVAIAWDWHEEDEWFIIKSHSGTVPNKALKGSDGGYIKTSSGGYIITQ